MSRKNNRQDTCAHFGKGRMRTLDKGKGRKVAAATKRQTVDFDPEAILASLTR